EFEKMDWVREKWGSDPVIEVGKTAHVRNAILEIDCENKKRVNIYAHTGWRKIEGKWVYLHAGGAIGTGAVENITVRLPDNLSRYELPNSCLDVPKAIRTSLKTLKLADKHMTYPLLAYTFLAPLCTVLKSLGIEPTFLMHLIGLTG